MKCISCQETISPKFVSAIKQNNCPACGKELMNQVNYKRIFEVEKQLKVLNFEDNVIFGVAAALASKFTLVPRDLALPEGEVIDEDLVENNLVKPGGGNKKPSVIKRDGNPVGGVTVDKEIEDDLDDLSEEMKQEIIESYGLDAGNRDSVIMSDSDDPLNYIDPSIMDEMDFMGSSEHSSSSSEGGSANNRHEALLQRAASVNPNKGIKRVM